ncbi:hypothetical protein ACFW0S_27560 [Citrobacter freundii]|uniref:hypothetical protein n=1 Tax=Citrobacter freundii TaxID=546 RepID=UPI00367308AE
MLNRVRRLLIKALGGITEDELRGVYAENKKLKQLLSPYTKFINDIYFYAGNYPAWKAQQDFRHFLHDAHMPLTQNYDSPARGYAYSVDDYLGRIVDAFVYLRQEVNLEGKGDDRRLWQKENLSQSRGDIYLNREQHSRPLATRQQSGAVRSVE